MWPTRLLIDGNIQAFISVNRWWGGALGMLLGTPVGSNSSWFALPRSFLTWSGLSPCQMTSTSSPRAETIHPAACLHPSLSHLTSQPANREARGHLVSLSGTPITPHFWMALPWWIPSELQRILILAFCLVVEKENSFDLACSFLTPFSSRNWMLAYSLTQWQKSLLKYSGVKETEVWISRPSLGKLANQMTRRNYEETYMTHRIIEILVRRDL